MPFTSYITLDKPQVSHCKMRLIITTIIILLLHEIVRPVGHKTYTAFSRVSELYIK